MRSSIIGFGFLVWVAALPAIAGPSGAEWIINYTGQNKDVASLVTSFNAAGNKCTQGKKIPSQTLGKMESIAKQMSQQPYAQTPQEGSALSEVISGVNWMKQLCAR